MIPETSWLARLSRCAIDPTAECFSRTAQFFSRALAQLYVKGGVYIYALENAGGHRVDLFEGDRAWSSGVTHARFSCLKKRSFSETTRATSNACAGLEDITLHVLCHT